MNGRITIADIAKKAGVSKGTVDRVLHKRGNVSPISKKKVLAAMQELDYQPNFIASTLAYNRTWHIAALLPNAEKDSFWKNPIIGINRALKAVRDYGVRLTYFYFRDADAKHFEECAEKVLVGQFDGLIIAPIYAAEGHRFLEKCQAIRLPFIQINTFLATNLSQFLAYIGQDSYYSGRLAAKLLSLGQPKKRKVIILHLEKAVLNSQHLIEKERGFQDFFKEQKKTEVEVVVASFETIHDKKRLRFFIADLLRQHADTKGIFVTTSRIFHIIPILNDLHLEELTLVGFDLIEENISWLKREKIDFLINQNPLKQGYLALINLFHYLLRKKELKPIQHLPLDIVMKENLAYYLEEQEEEKLHLIV